jgi:hypothetical protein
MARQQLPVLLHAAAVAERGVEQVPAGSATSATADEGKERARRQIIDILGADPTADQRIGLLQEFLAYPDKTRSGHGDDDAGAGVAVRQRRPRDRRCAARAR